MKTTARAAGIAAAGAVCLGLVWSGAGCATGGRGPGGAPGGAPAVRAAPEIDTAFLEQFAATFRFRLGQPTGIKVTPDGSVLFLRSPARSFVQDLYEFDPATGSERRILRAEDLLGGEEEVLTPEELARRERQRMASRGIASFGVSEDGRTLLVPLSGRLFLVDRASGGVREIGDAAAGFPIDPRFSPDGRFVACVRNGLLHIIDVETGAERRLTPAQGETVTFGVAEFVAQEEMDRHEGYWWAPDSSSIAVQRTETAGMEVFTIADPMHPEREASRWPYPRPGGENARVSLLIGRFDGSVTGAAWDAEAFPYLARVAWKKNSPLTVLVQNRTQTEQRLLAFDGSTGAPRVLLTERDGAWINLRGGVPRWLGDGGSFLWLSESEGEWRLERIRADGLDRVALTAPGFGLRQLLGVDEGAGVAYVSASADPTQAHVWRVALDGAGAPERLTSAPGVHSAVVGEKSGVVVVSSQTLEGAPSWTVLKRDGSVAGSLQSVAERPVVTPRTELVTVEAAGRVYHGAVTRPSGFVAGRRYPVLVDVYGGPGVNKAVRSRNAYLMAQWMADHGVIVVSIDGRGTPNRGRDWERAVKDDLGTIPVEDQVIGLRALGARFPEMDLTRVGIYGWSFGGYMSALAVMQRPEVFHAGVAGAPVADWRDYDTHYTERYMGLPDANRAGYERASVLTHAPALERPLLIIHGTADDNVYFMHSLKMSEALFRAGRPFEFLPLAGFTHMVPDPVVTTRLYARQLGFLLERIRAEGR